MKKTLLIATGLFSLASLAWMQVNQTDRRVASTLIPAGPLIYLEAKDFHSLLAEWNQSGVKRAWLTSANYRVFSNSNLFQKLDALYQEYAVVAGFLPGLPGTLELAGRESALGLYNLREQQFVYITRLDESQLVKSQLWRLRDKFTTRQASGTTFYLRRDDASKRMVAFAFTNNWLVLATRDDLMANTLALIARQKVPNLSAETWFSAAMAQAGNAGEMRMALNIQSLIADDRFRSYWIQRNIPELRPFSAEVADVQRTNGEIAENRTLVRMAEQDFTLPANTALDSIAALRSIAPPDITLARGWAAPSSQTVQSLIESKLISPNAASPMHQEYAPDAASTDNAAGTEQDLETRIDEPALANDISGGIRSAALKQLILQASPDALLQIQSSVAAGAFVRTPCVLVLSAAANWQVASVREALSSAVETLWSTSRLGVEWQSTTLGQHTAEQLNGLASLLFAIDGKRLFLANDSALLLASLARIAAPPSQRGPAYIAEFHAGRERSEYRRIMQALDFRGRSQSFLVNPQGERTPQFFSENLESLGSIAGFIQSMTITNVEAQGVEKQLVVYR